MIKVNLGQLRQMVEDCGEFGDAEPLEVVQIEEWIEDENRCSCGLKNPGPEHRAHYPLLCAEYPPPRYEVGKVEYRLPAQEQGSFVDPDRSTYY